MAEAINWFRQRRDALKKTQGEIAKALGTIQSTVSTWELGQPPKLAMVHQLATVYGVSPKKIRDVIGEMHEAKQPSEAGAK